MILVALGSNLGDRAGQLTRARQMMNAQGMNIVAESSLHETPALMPENAPESWNIPFLNQVVQVETTASAVEVLAQLKAIEVALGRTPRERWAPREVDLDIIAYDALTMESETLTLPHPQMHLRRFVLAPLNEIAPEWMHPVLRKTTTQLLAECA